VSKGVVSRVVRGPSVERVADGVRLVRGGALRTLNVFLIDDEGGGVTLYDAGARLMTRALQRAAAPRGGVNRVVLGHADADHRGAAPGLGVPVLCHTADRAAAEAGDVDRYYRYERLGVPGRYVYPRLLRHWDGGPVRIAGTLDEGDEIAGFRVVHLPGHAPGQIALVRERDRLALKSDCFYMVDPETSRPQPPGLPHPAFTLDEALARASIRKLAALDLAKAWPGHLGPLTGDVRGALERAAAA
jgi:glyoxylase-like metal-dependent hydrolase (beta-lactamase superfamily II)